MKILLIEDDPRVSAFIRKGLEEQEYSVDVAYDGINGSKLAVANFYDLIILDVILPNLNGVDVCQHIRKENRSIPILLLTALGSDDDKVKGLDSGADDYVVKPFSFKELLARIRALTRRQVDHENGVVYKVADLEMNTVTRIVTRGGLDIKLTAKEFALLEVFVRNINKVLTRSDLADRVWDTQFDTGTNVVDVYVNYLRKKIDRSHPKKLIHTIIGVGYVMREDE